MYFHDPQFAILDEVRPPPLLPAFPDFLFACRRLRLSLASRLIGCFGRVCVQCTSAVSIDVEESLYLSAVKQGITCLTISQRLSLPEFHATEMTMGANSAGAAATAATAAAATGCLQSRDGCSLLTAARRRRRVRTEADRPGGRAGGQHTRWAQGCGVAC